MNADMKAVTRPFQEVAEIFDRAGRSVRPQPYATRSYAAFRVAEPFTISSNTYVLPIDENVCTLDQAVTAALCCGKAIYHKEHLLIREADERGVRLHVYAIRKAKPRWVHPAGEAMPRRVEDLYPDKVCVFDAGVLA